MAYEQTEIDWINVEHSADDKYTVTMTWVDGVGMPSVYSVDVTKQVVIFQGSKEHAHTVARLLREIVSAAVGEQLDRQREHLVDQVVKQPNVPKDVIDTIRGTGSTETAAAA